MRNVVFCLSISMLLFCGRVDAQPKAQDDKFSDFEAWLEKPADERGDFGKQPFKNLSLTKKQAKQAAELLWNDFAARIKKEREQEWKDKVIELGDLKMKFDYKIFGDKPKNGRSLFISMHGGGGAPARVNEQQWRNQIGLYKPEEGVYLAPRAPTNTWNLWHEEHIDVFFKRIIQNAIVFEDVDPNRVYIMGYSAGGDGVYQLAPRMADSLAAAAMMAGHPNGVSPKGLRNIGFTLHMGGKDRAYKRNKIAAQWKTKLAKLKEADPEGYEHEVVIHEECGHWMERKDAVAVPWMAKFTRDPVPKKIVWRPTGPKDGGFYWLRQREGKAKRGSEVTASLDGQKINIESTLGMEQVGFYLNDDVLDLDESVTIAFNGKDRGTRRVFRNLSHMVNSLEAYGDPHRIYSAEFVAPVPKELLAAEAEAKKAADEAKKKKKMEAEAKKKREAEEKKKREAEDKEKQAGK